MKKTTLQQVLNGSAIIAQRRAFKKKLPFAISSDGKVFLVYPDNKKVEATAEQLDKLIISNS